VAGNLRQQANGSWELRVYLGRDQEGRVRHKSRTFRGTKREAEKALARMVVEFEDGLEALEPVEDRPIRWGLSTTINDAIGGWKLNGWADLSPSTRLRYQGIWDNHVRDSIGRRRITETTPWDVERYLRRLKDEKKLSQSSVRYTRAMLHRACRLARKWSNGALPNPVTDTELPEWHYDEQRDAVRSPTVEEVRAILVAAEELDGRLAVFYRVTAATGGRRGEVCALRWSDIDWDGSTIRFDESIVGIEGPARVKAPKTRASVRRVSIDDGTLEILRSVREQQDRLAGRCAVEVSPNGFVFSVEPGAVLPPHPDPFTSGFRKVCTRAGVSADIHLHSLRHFQSTQLDSVISEAQKQSRMGWTTVQMARRYTDVVNEEDRKAANHIGALLK
jgi:integrase